MEKRIVLFGGSGVGKSSLINLLLDLSEEEKAKTSDSAVGCTLESKCYEKNGYKLYDTAGLDEGTGGTISMARAIASLIRFLEKMKDGIHLLIFVIKKDRIKKHVEDNYNLFIDVIYKRRVPIILVVTGCEAEAEVGTWWENEKDKFAKYKMEFNQTICGCASSGQDEQIRKSLIAVREEVAEETKQQLLEAIDRHALRDPFPLRFEVQEVTSVIKRFIIYFRRLFKRSTYDDISSKYRELEGEMQQVTEKKMAAEICAYLKIHAVME